MAESTTVTESPPVESRGLQVSLGGLMVLVLAAGVAAGVARSAREVWGFRTTASSTSGLPWNAGSAPVPIERTAGMVLEVAAIFLLVIMGRTLIALFRSVQPADAPDRKMQVWSIAWRFGAVGFLLWFVSEESRVLRVDLATLARLNTLMAGWAYRYQVRQQLFPICGLFAILGLVVGMGASCLFPGGPRRGNRPYWLFVILAGVVAVLIASLPLWASLLPYLILIALEAVTNAMYHRPNPGPGISTRLLRAGIDASVSAVLCLALALAVARDFEMARRAKAWAPNAAGAALRLFFLVAAAAAGTYIAAVTIPAIHPWFAQGFLYILDPVMVGLIVCCFALFGAGMAARTIAGAPERQSSLWLTRLSAFYRLAILGAVLFAALKALPDSSVVAPNVPHFISYTVAFINGAVSAVWDRFPDWFADSAMGMLAIEGLMWTSLILATVCFVIELLVRDNMRLTSPFDQLAKSPGRMWQFIWMVLGFVVVCLAALPTLIVAGQVVLHLRVHGADLMARGWAR